jgi:hypothetical protein
MSRKLAHVGAMTAIATLPLASFASTAHAQPTRAAASTQTPYCSTRLLNPEEMQAGAHSIVTCYSTLTASLQAVGVDLPPAQAATVLAQTSGDVSGLVAVHYKMNSGAGEYLAIAGTTCNGGGVSFNAGDAWNDVITATRHQACSQVKHWSDANYSGAEETTNGGSGSIAALRTAVAGQVSSIKYFGPTN